MPQVHLTPGEQAWARYLAIYQATDKAYNISKFGWIKHGDIDKALQLLGEATVRKYKLSVEFPRKHWKILLEKDKIPSLQLETIEQMLHANISEWDSGFPGVEDQSFGHDFCVDGERPRPEGYLAHSSLYKLVGERIYKELLIKDATFENTNDIYQRIQSAVRKELRRYSAAASKDSIVRQKVTAINLAMQRLWRGIEDQHEQNAPAEDNIHLYSGETMLDMPFKHSDTEMGMSVREALNLSRWNPFSIFGIKPALWGKTTSLINVEEQLQRSVNKEPIRL